MTAMRTLSSAVSKEVDEDGEFVGMYPGIRWEEQSFFLRSVSEIRLFCRLV